MSVTRSLFALTVAVSLAAGTAHGEDRKAYLGVGLGEAEGKVAITQIGGGSPAEKGGLKEGDRVISINGGKVDERGDLIDRVVFSKPGDAIKIEVERDGKREVLEVVLEEKPKTPERVGLLGVKAPDIDHIKQWHNLPEGKDGLELADFKDKTVFLYCFQSW